MLYSIIVHLSDARGEARFSSEPCEAFGRLAKPRQNGVLAHFLRLAVRRTSESNRPNIDDHGGGLRLARVHHDGLPSHQSFGASFGHSHVGSILAVASDQAPAGGIERMEPIRSSWRKSFE